MILHSDLGNPTFTRNRKLLVLINKDLVVLGGNIKLKIFGTLKCSSGKRMKIENRVFFESAGEALNLGYRPCGHCMKLAYKKWKDESVR